MSPYFEAPAIVEPDLGSLDDLAPVITNIGTGPTGFHMKFTFSGLSSSLSYFEIQSQGGLRKMRFEPPDNFDNGHSVEFNTNSGERVITLVQSETFNGLPWLTSDSDWLQLYGGDNVLAMSDSHHTWNELSFTPKYWGV
jgi:hypothetical protein